MGNQTSVRYAVRTMATGIIAVSSMAIVGHMFRVDNLYRLGTIGMAFTTACCLLLTGISLMLLSGRSNGH